MADVFVGGNHDSALTLAAEAQAGIKMLDGAGRPVDGLTFVGPPDPRTSRYGQGIVPSARLRRQARRGAGTAVGELACTAPAPVIAVLHGPLAGATALQHGCGKITLALDGHTHEQAGPTADPAAGRDDRHQFVGGVSGGAPTKARSSARSRRG